MDSACCEECHNFQIRYVTNKPIQLQLLLEKKSVTMEFDTDSGSSVISESMCTKLFSTYTLQ